MDDAASNELMTFLVTANACAGELLTNATYVTRELPSLAVSDAQRRAIDALCRTWLATKHDVVVEIADARDLGEPPTSHVMRERVHRIVRWLGEDISLLDAVVALLDPRQAPADGAEDAFVLVAESGGNVLRAITRVKAAAEHYFTTVGDAPSAAP